MSAEDLTWHCSICGEGHQGLATVFGSPAPAPWLEAAESARRRGDLNDDMCVLPTGGSYRHFIRGHIEVKAPELPQGTFAWSVWVELSAEDMQTSADHWNDPRREELLPMPGSLVTDLPFDEPTLGLKVRLFTRPAGSVPFVKLDRSQQHQLVEEQRTGITAQRVAALNAQLLHQE
jgi:hypothetical protein